MKLRAIAIATVLGLAGCGQKAPDPAELVRQLREGTAEQRQAAVDALSQLGDAVAPVLPEIEKAVLDDDPAVRRAAVATLRAYGKDASTGLVVALDDSEADIREAAATALGELGLEGTESVPNLTQRLSDENFRVAAAARKALVQMGDEARPALARVVVTGKDAARDNALRGLVEMGAAALPDLIEAASSREADVRRAVLESMIVMKPPADVVLGVYRKALSDPDSGVRDVAARAIQALGSAAAAASDDLVPLLADEDNAGPAEWALRDIGPEAVPSLTKALQHRTPEIRRGAAKTLGTMGEDAEPATGALVAALSDEDASVRREAVASLSTLGPPEAAVEGLVARLGDEDERCAHRAAEALERVPDLARGPVGALAKSGEAPGAARAEALLARLPPQ